MDGLPSDVKRVPIGVVALGFRGDPANLESIIHRVPEVSRIVVNERAWNNVLAILGFMP